MSESDDSSKMPKGMTLEQAKLWGAERRIKDLSTRLDAVVKLLEDSNKENKKKIIVSSDSESSSDGGRSGSIKKKKAKYSSSSDDDDHEYYNRRKKKHYDDRDLKLDLPDFYGNMTEPEKFFEWSRRAETLFEYKGYSERKRCKIAECKLAGYASLWYEGLKKKRVKEGKDKIRTWEQLKKYMKKRFVPADYVQSLYIKLQSFKQGSRSVEQYITDF